MSSLKQRTRYRIAFYDATHYSEGMERKSFSEMHCSVAQCLEVVGEWWTLLIVRDAFLGVTRFDEFSTSAWLAWLRSACSSRLPTESIRRDSTTG
jgi:hypothetical protein